MVNIKNTLMTKTAALLLSIAMLIGLIPVGVTTALSTPSTELGTLSCITDGGVLTDANGSDATATFAGLTLQWVEADPLVGRTKDGWWIGVKMTAPADMLEAEDFTDVTYQRCLSAAKDEWTTPTPFWDAQDSDKATESTERFITLWGIVNEEYLNDALLNGKTINFAWRFDWDANGDYEQTAALKIDPQNITLKKDATQVYPATSENGTVSVISDGLALTGDANDNIVRVTYTADTVLKWVAADPSVTRFNDGWWAGIKVTAPADLQVEADFANVTYKNNAGGVWSEARSFWNKKDSANEATEHFIGLWGLLNEELLANAEDTLEYIWQFDWNGDNVYEQIVILEIDPAKITLVDTSDVQVYPELGSVTTITGGDVVGSGTGNVKVTASELTLNWSPANTAIGRNQDGWWAGIQITAPENAVITETDDVNYQSKVGNGNWSDNKSFFANQDSAKDGSVHYMQLWSMLDRAMLQQAAEAGENITCQWQFDWDKDGSYEQLVTFEIVPDTDKIVLNRVDRTDFAFTEIATDKKVWIGEGTYDLEAKSELAPGTVTYAIDETASTAGAATVDNNGVVTLNTVGTVTVIATIAQDDVYNLRTASFTFEIVKEQVEGFTISSPANITYGYEDETYGVNKFVNVAVDPTGNGVIKYAVVEGDAAEIEDESSPVLTIKKAGTVKVQALRQEDALYYEAFAEYTLTIEKADQTGVKFTDSIPNELVHSFDNPYTNITVEGNNVVGEGVITYAITAGNDVAEVVNDTQIQTIKSGTFTLTVTVAGDDCYNEKVISKDFTVVQGERNTFAFAESGPFTMTFNDNGNTFVKLADTSSDALGADEKDGATITYEIVEQAALEDGDTSPDENPVATLDADGATLLIARSGKVKVKATISETEKYVEKSVEYELTINKDTQSFTFANGNNISRNYGIKEYTFLAENNNLPVPTAVPSKADGRGYGAGVYTFELVGTNTINAKVSLDGSKIEFGDSDAKIGDLTVKAVKAADDCYKSCEAEYTLTIQYLDPSPTANDLGIDKTPNANGWYDGDITISAPAGYEISYDDELSTNDWASSVLYAVEGTEAPVVYLRAENGDITDEIVLAGYKMDKSAPVDLAVEYKISIWKTVAGKIFGFKNETVQVTLSAKDVVSGIDYIEYSINGETPQRYEYNGEQTISYNDVYIAPQYRNKVTFSVTDIAGNKTEYVDAEDRTVVVDSIAPTIDVKYDFETERYNEQNGIYYTQGKVTVEFVITEANFDLADAPVVSVATNGGAPAVQSVVWTQIEGTDKWCAAIDLVGEGNDFVVKVTFTDSATNEMIPFEQEIHIDDTNPVIEEYVFTAGDVKGTNNGRDYYDVKQNVTIRVEEHNFDAARVQLVVEAKDLAGNVIDISSKKYDEYAKNPANWEHDGDVHTLKTNGMLFDVEANYTLKLTVTDLADNKTTAVDKLFTVDTTAPATPYITYDKSALAAVVEAVTFGFFKAPLEVTVTSSDVVAGLKYIEYAYVGTKGQYVTDKVEVNGSEATENTIKFTIPANTEFKGIISATAYDWSLNKSDTQNVGYDYEGTALGGVVLDNIAPSRVVTPSTADRVVSNANLKDVKNYVYSAENSNVTLYYKDKATVTFKVTEANFYKEDVHVFVNGVETNPTDWALDANNNWVGTITLANEGDYVVTMTYTDKSGNEMPAYTSERIVIDHTAPVINVSYADNHKYVHKIDDREYYNANRTATITIKEHNFRADDVVVTVYAKDVVGANITPVGTLTFGANGVVNEYFNDGCNRAEWSAYKEGTWRRDDDTFELVLEYNEDANYTFDIAYVDLATQSAADYAAELFTVDKTKPSCVNVAYSTNLYQNILEDLTFGYYNAQMTVTITAQDDISGVYHFLYSYLKGANVSSVNAQLIDEAITNAEIKHNGKTATAEFKIPKLALKEDNQFNGIIEFTAYDRCENESQKFTDENTVIVVDNIKPTAQVFFSDPVQNANGVSYYAGDIAATVIINEANFYSEDVQVIVTELAKNGAEVRSYPAQVTWVDNSVDVHTGTFTLTEDNNYIVSVTYTDRSKNEMAPFVSNQLTIDTKDPVITVSNVKHQSANNAETISVTVSVTDTNIPLDGFKPVLNAVVKEDGSKNSFKTVAIPLGDATSTVVDGNDVHSYTVNNLEIDGFYSLVCTALDYANHSVSTINSAADQGGEATVETVNFSVNREGSVFWIETVHTDKYTNETFTDKLNGAYANGEITVKVHEINVDKVDENADKKTILTLNDGSASEDIPLTEGTNYSKNVLVGAGGWYETIYTLNNDNFSRDGVYSLNIITYDMAGNGNVNTKTEEGTISFILDRTNPIISANVKTNQRINAADFWVEFEISETNLAAETVALVLKDYKGKVVETAVKGPENNTYKFLVKQGLNYSFEIVAKDLAGNTSEIYKVERLTVSTNALIRWYANTGLFWGSIGGTITLAGLIILLVFLKKKNKNVE